MISENKKHISIADFELIQELGDGAYGRVLRAKKKDEINDVYYAVKMINKRKMKMEKKEHHVFIEKDMLKYLSHPGIIKLQYTFQDKDQLYFVLELANDPFSEYMILYNKQLNFPIIQFYMAQLLSILQYIHSQGVVHRDIKPENLLLSSEKHLKLIDFGTSYVFDPTKMPQDKYEKIQYYRTQFKEKEFKRSTSWVGTMGYLSPEVLNDVVCGPGTDLWAFGCIIYKLFTGTLPFQSQDEDILFQKIREQTISYPECVPAVARDFIEKIMCKNPQNRICDYEILRAHPFFDGIDFNKIWSSKPPQFTRVPKKSKTFINQQQFQLPQEMVIFQEIVEKDSGCNELITNLIIIYYFTPRCLVLQLLNGKPDIYYTNPKLNDKKTVININQFTKVQLIKQDQFMIIDEQRNKYLFQTKKASEWIKNISEILKQHY